MLDLYVKYDHPMPSESGEIIEDIVVGAYAPGTPINLAVDHPGCVFLPYDGVLDDLPRIGPPPPHGTFDMRPRRAPASMDLGAYADRRWKALLARGAEFNVAGDGEPPLMILCDGTNETRADLALLVLFGQENLTGTQSWTDNDGKVSVLTGMQFIRLARLAGMWVSATYPALAAIQADVIAGTIKTAAEIDARLSALTA